ncbi:hypothetical protein LG047_12725 [Methylocystis sp. WRRC1]|uniref:hypothetical protein n=1 Tax=unclassified Methylocystis TaxID=2625913 RepID=UPI0001F86848|nr:MULTISPECIES: hypothetical protein [unclassified Methylocystis]MCC3246174.1 hypothetical protein [Methylocystis sp. WRRC1]
MRESLQIGETVAFAVETSDGEAHVLATLEAVVDGRALVRAANRMTFSVDVDALHRPEQMEQAA